MDAKTETALRASIKHWEENVAAATPEEASTEPGDCALCHKFCRDYYDHCVGCPIFEKTGMKFCDGTPYEDAYSALRDWTDGRVYDESAFRAAAQRELDFLRSLLPGESGETT